MSVSIVLVEGRLWSVLVWFIVLEVVVLCVICVMTVPAEETCVLLLFPDKGLVWVGSSKVRSRIGVFVVDFSVGVVLSFV